MAEKDHVVKPNSHAAVVRGNVRGNKKYPNGGREDTTRDDKAFGEQFGGIRRIRTLNCRLSQQFSVRLQRVKEFTPISQRRCLSK